MSRKIETDLVMTAAIEVAITHGYRNMTRDQIAIHAGVSTGTVTNVLGNMKQLRRAVMRYALRTKVRQIIAQGIIAGDPLTTKLGSKERLAILQSIA